MSVLDYDLRLSELGALGQLIIKCDYWFQKMLSAGNDDTKVGFIDSAIETALFLKAYSKVPKTVCGERYQSSGRVQS